jgi:hypothetical protein
MSSDNIAELLRLQAKHAKKINMSLYFDLIDGKSLTVLEFEEFLMKSTLSEVDRVFRIINDSKKLEEILSYMNTLKRLLNSLDGNSQSVFKLLTKCKDFSQIIPLSRLLREYPEVHRVLLVVPQGVTTINFTKLIVKNKGKLDNLKPSDLLASVIAYMPIINKGELVLLTRKSDTSNNAMNRAFGPKGFTCPGNILTMKFISSILSLINNFDIKVEGEGIYDDSREGIANKGEIKLTFTKRYLTKEEIASQEEAAAESIRHDHIIES